MVLKKFFGTGVALVTPFTQDGRDIDFNGLHKLLISTADKGADYFVVMGTTGESPTVSNEEKMAVLRFVCDNNPRQLPIVYGLGGNNTAQVMENIRSTDFHGVDAILSVSPYYNRPSQAGIVAHFQKIADLSPVPVILYNVPGRTASNMTVATTITLSEHPNIIGIKEASGSIEQAKAIMQAKPDGFLLLSGDDLLTADLYSVGAKGVISVLANGFAAIFKEVKACAAINDHDGAQKCLSQLSKINPLMYEEGNPVGIKYVLQLQHICNGAVRLPLLRASEKLSEAIKVEVGRISDNRS